jgi:uncharacterized protein YhbP (UPF0306 family)
VDNTTDHGRRQTIQRQVTKGLALHQQGIADLQPAQFAGEFATRHHDEKNSSRRRVKTIE